jgi:flagellar basal-body rod modification protein FlgD
MTVNGVANTDSSAGSAASSSPAASAASTATLANQNVFLQLLVAQLKYQDPENPASGTEFVTQLAQFSDLSNTTQMAADLDAIKAALTSSGSGTSQSGGSPQSGGTGSQGGTSQSGAS